MLTFPFVFIPLQIFYSSLPLLYEDSHPDFRIPTPIPRTPTLISRIPTLIPHIPIIPHPDSPHSYHSHPDSPHSLHSPHSVPRFPIPSFKDSQALVINLEKC